MNGESLEFFFVPFTEEEIRSIQLFILLLLSGHILLYSKMVANMCLSKGQPYFQKKKILKVAAL